MDTKKNARRGWVNYQVHVGGGVHGIVMARKRMGGKTWYQVFCGGLGNLWYTAEQLRAFGQVSY